MAVRSLTGNKGEWSELYAFFRLLAEGRVHAADEHARRIDAVYYPIAKVVREECAGSPVEYVIDRGASRVDVVAGGSRVCSVAQAELGRAADRLLAAIKAGSGSFVIDDIADFADSILVRKVKAPSRDKTDIKMQIEDVFTNARQNVGFSIKSELGGAPTLLNASRATNFVFAVRGLSPDDAARINAIEGRSKIGDRMGEICRSRGSLVYRGMLSGTFEDNLVLIDGLLPAIVADMFEVYYLRDISPLIDLAAILERENPRGFRRRDVYAYKLRKMLCACALGMKPSSIWDGSEDANGGYVIVKESGEVLAYHIYNREAFERYLLDNTILERASTTRHDYLTLYEADDELRISLNLQIRFKREATR